MKLFSRGSNPSAAVGPASAVAPPNVAVAPVVSAPAAPEQPPAPDVAEILESSVKDISEKVARLASSVESSGEERMAFEAKLTQMEDRMRKLSSLTEMISSQYNPFMGDAPPQREALPSADSGLAAPPLPPSLAQMDAAPALALEVPFEAPMPEEETGEDLLENEAPTLDFQPPAHHEAPAPFISHAPAESVHIERFGEDFQSSMILLKWADLLLQNARSREGVADLAEYYHNVGWIGNEARDQLLAYADGIAFDAEANPGPEWRATAEFHEVSLLFLEKLKAVQRGAR